MFLLRKDTREQYVQILIIAALLICTFGCTLTHAATLTTWCKDNFAKQKVESFSLCYPSLTTRRPSWCTYNNFRASQPITLRDPDIFDCANSNAQCLFNKLSTEEQKYATLTENNLVCVKDQDVDNIVKIYKEDYSGSNVTTTDQSSQSENNRCFFVRAVKPLEMTSNGANQYLLVLTNRYLLVLDMTTEKLVSKYPVIADTTTLTDKPSKMAVYRNSNTQATIYINLSTQTLLVFKLEITAGVLTITQSKSIALATNAKLSSTEYIQDLQTISYIDTDSTATHMAVLAYGSTTSTNGILIYKTSTLNKWTFADQTEERKIYGFAHGQFASSPSYAETMDCNKVSVSRPLLLIQSKSQINLVQLFSRDFDNLDLTKKPSIIYTHDVTGERIYSASAFTECFGTLEKKSQSVWVTVGVASTTASSNLFSPRLFVFNLPEISSKTISNINTEENEIYDATDIGKSTCSTSYSSSTSTPKYSKSGTCTTRPYKEVELATKSAVPSKIAIGMYKTSNISTSDIYSTFYHTINVATRESIEVFSFQEFACTDSESDSSFTMPQTALLNTDGKIADMFISENGQHIFASLSRKAFDIDARTRLQDICTLLASSNPPSSLSKFTEACKKYPTKYTAFDFIGYFSMCNGGWTCPRYGDAGILSIDSNTGYANVVSISAGTHTIRPTMVYSCEPGFYCPSNNEGRRRPCPAGFKCATGGLLAPTVCKPSETFDKTCSIEGSTGEQTCPDGQICLNPMMSIPVPPGYLARKFRSQLFTCRNGQYCPLSTQGVDGSGATIVNACPALNYCETPYSIVPTPCLEQIGNRTQYCPTGTYGSDEHYCPEGYYCPTLASKVLCEDGYYCPRGTKEPLACTAGYYCPNTNSMLLCPSGYHCAAGSTYPKRCQWFSYCPEGSGKQQSFYLGILLMFLVLFLVLVTFVVVRCVTASYKKKKMKQKKIKQDQEISGQNALANIGINIANFIQGNEQFNYDSTGSLVNEPPFSKKNFTIDYAFEDLSYIRKKSEEVIFEGATGRIYHGRTTCIIGVNNEATSSLLNTLAGRHHLGFVHGKVMINEQIKDPHEFRNIISFAPKQLDMAKELKVHELLRFAGHSRLPSYYTYSQVGRRVEKTCKVLGIENFMYDTIGKSKKHGLDEELRVFVNMALEMVADPVCLFVDNPFDEIPLERKKFLCKAFKLAAESGTTVVSTMVRPRNDVFQLFDDCIIMGKNGGIVYNGPTKDALRFFEEIGFKCPNYENPPDFFLDVCLGNVERPGDPNFEPERLLHLWDLKKEENEKKWRKSRNSNETQDEQEQQDDEEVGASVIDPQQVLLGSEVAKERQRKPIAFLGQYLLFSLRALLQLSRHYKGVFFDFFFHFALAVIIGGFYFNMDFIGPLSSTLQKLCPTFISNQCALPRIDKIAPMSIVTVSALAIAAMQSSLKCFGADKELYRREAQNGINKMSYFLGKLTGEIPSLLIYPLVFVTFWYILVNPEAEFYTYYGLFLLFEIVFSSLGFFVSVFVQRTHAEFVGVMYIILCALLGGVQPTVRTMSKEWYTLVLVCSSPVRWAVELMYTVEIRKYQESNQNVATALENYGFSYKAYYISPIILIAMTIMFLALSFVGLVMRDPQAVERIKTLTRVYIRKGKRKLKKLKSERKKPGDYVFQQESEIQVLEDGEESDSDEDDELLLQQDEVYQPPSYETATQQ